MQTENKDLIDFLHKSLPDVVLTSDLQKLGFFKSPTTWSKLRKEGTGPKFHTVGDNRVIYFKNDVIEWASKSGNTPKKPKKGNSTQLEFNFT